MTNAQLLEELGINLKGKTAGTHKYLCPKCSHTRKNKRDPCLSVNIDEGWYKCHHPDCNWSGRVYQGPAKMEKKDYVKPAARLEKLRPALIQFFEKQRKISNNTLLRFKITEAEEWMPKAQKAVPAICFNYFQDDELVNIKFRANGKDFKMAKDAKLIFYNIDAIKDEEECVIVEGEIDCMSCHESDVYNSTSVPNGASKGNQSLEYLDNCWESFKDKKKIIIATDDDEAGLMLRDELARRLGYERCWRITYPSDAVVWDEGKKIHRACKDLNEVLVHFNKDAVKKCIYEAEPWPLEGILSVADMMDDIISFYENGYPNGYEIPIPGIGKKLQLMLGQYTTVTGIPGSGKSEWVDWVMVEMSRVHGWKWGILSPENQPASIHATKLIQKYCRKSFALRDNPEYRIPKHEIGPAMNFINDHFHFININEVDISITGVMQKMKELVLRLGINGFLIDPWNKLRHEKPKVGSDTDYIRDALNQISYSCKMNGVHTILIAHPTKMKKVKVGKEEVYEVPTMYSISGSADFYNMTDNGVSVYRNFKTGVVDIYIQKVRYNWLGEIGFSSYMFDWHTQQYVPLPQRTGDLPPSDSGDDSDDGLPF